jgi:hypothetical protein
MTEQLIKFNIGDTAYCYNVGMQFPLIKEIVIKGIIKKDNETFYTDDLKLWIKEEYVYCNKKIAYENLVVQANNEFEQITE